MRRRRRRPVVCGLLALALQPSNAALADQAESLTVQQLKDALAAPEVQQARPLIGDPSNAEQAIMLFEAAASRGNPIAEAYLGYVYYMGYGVVPNDRIAADWYHRSAVKGFTDAQLRLGLIYVSGRDLGSPERNVPRDAKAGEDWIERAAEGGSATGLDLVAHYLSYGVTSAVLTGKQPTQEDRNDFEKAVRFYRQAAAQDDTFAMEELCALRAYIVPVPEETPEWCDLARKDPSYGTLNPTAAARRMGTKALLEDPNFPSLPSVAR